MSTPIEKLHALGQSIWYDNIERRLLKNGELAGMIERGEIRGVTSNPSIFKAAIADSSDYDDELITLAKAGKSADEIYETLAIADIRAATDLFRPLYDETNGGDGYVSLEVSPLLAHNTEGTAAEAKRLWDAVDRPNLMIKIPATQAGLPAITETIASGINVNVTLIFSQARYGEVIDAYLTGLEQRVVQGGKIDNIASVASFFVSRIDAKTDKRLEAHTDSNGNVDPLAVGLMGRLAVANAKEAYQLFKRMFGSDRFDLLAKAGARIQRPLWASTSTKNPNYSDVKYVNELIGPNSVNTVPPHTLDAFRDHGTALLTLESGLAEASQAFAELRALGIPFDELTQELEDEGVASFAKAFETLMETVEHRRANA